MPVGRPVDARLRELRPSHIARRSDCDRKRGHILVRAIFRKPRPATGVSRFRQVPRRVGVPTFSDRSISIRIAVQRYDQHHRHQRDEAQHPQSHAAHEREGNPHANHQRNRHGIKRGFPKGQCFSLRDRQSSVRARSAQPRRSHAEWQATSRWVLCPRDARRRHVIRQQYRAGRNGGKNVAGSFDCEKEKKIQERSASSRRTDPIASQGRFWGIRFVFFPQARTGARIRRNDEC